MINFLKYIILIFTCFICLTCSKKPEGINIQVYDPFMNQPIADASVSLIEMSLSNSGGNCNIIKTISTDGNGDALMTSVSLSTKSKYNYFVVVSNAYGKDAIYSCANHSSDDYLPKTNAIINKKIYYYADAIDWKINISNLNSGINNFNSISTDSISIQIFRDFEYFSDLKSDLNGSKELVRIINLNTTVYNSLNPVNPNSYSCCTYNYLDKIYPGKYKVIVFKNKSGVTSTNTYTEYVLPVQQYHFNVNW